MERMRALYGASPEMDVTGECLIWAPIVMMLCLEEKSKGIQGGGCSVTLTRMSRWNLTDQGAHTPLSPLMMVSSGFLPTIHIRQKIRMIDLVRTCPYSVSYPEKSVQSLQLLLLM